MYGTTILKIDISAIKQDILVTTVWQQQKGGYGVYPGITMGLETPNHLKNSLSHHFTKIYLVF